jgi:hypothetical protein
MLLNQPNQGKQKLPKIKKHKTRGSIKKSSWNLTFEKRKTKSIRPDNEHLCPKTSTKLGNLDRNSRLGQKNNCSHSTPRNPPSLYMARKPVGKTNDTRENITKCVGSSQISKSQTVRAMKTSQELKNNYRKSRKSHKENYSIA